MTSFPDPPYQWGEDELFDSGPAINRDVASKPAGWPVVPQGIKPGTAAAIPHLNQVFKTTGRWLRALADVQLANWGPPVALDPVTDLNSVCASLDSFVAVGGAESYISEDGGHTWASFGSLSTEDLFRAFDADGRVCALDATNKDTLYGSDGASWSSNTETTGDKWLAGLWTGTRLVGLGVTLNPDLVFGGSATAGHWGTQDLTRHHTPAVPDFGGSYADSIASHLIADKGVYLAHNGDGRVLCLVSYRLDQAQPEDGSNVYQYISTDHGVNWAETTDVITLTDETANSIIAGLAYDEARDLWVAITAEGRLFSSPVGSESWTLLGTVDDSNVEPVQDSLQCFGHVWLYQGSAGQLYWSRDGGTSWQKVVMGRTWAAPLAYSAVHRRFVAITLDTTNFVQAGVAAGVANDTMGLV